MDKKTARLYHNSINEQGHSSNVRNSSDSHNLRNTPEIENAINSKTKNNILFINSQRVDPLDTQNNYNLVKETCDNLKKDFKNLALKNNHDVSLSANKKAELQTDRAKLKAKLKKWAENEKATDLEKSLWRKIYTALGKEELKSDVFISELQALGKTVKRFNDKKKALSELDHLNQLVGTKSMNINLSIITKEVVYKIPEQWNTEIKPKDFLNIVRAINKKFYPDFNPIYETIHLDEQSPHAHVRLSGMNNKTKQFDMQNTLLNRVRSFDKEKRLPQNKRYSELSKEEIQLFGQIYQEQIFTVFNKCLNQLQYDFKVEKRSLEEKKNDFLKFKDKKRKIADREYNIQNHLSEKNAKAQQILNENKEIITMQCNDIQMLKSEQKTIKKDVSLLMKLKKQLELDISAIDKIKTKILKGLNHAFKFAVDSKQQDLDIYHKEQKEISDIDKDFGKKLEDSAVKLQPTKKKKNAILDIEDY